MDNVQVVVGASYLRIITGVNLSFHIVVISRASYEWLWVDLGVIRGIIMMYSWADSRILEVYAGVIWEIYPEVTLPFFGSYSRHD